MFTSKSNGYENRAAEFLFFGFQLARVFLVIVVLLGTFCAACFGDYCLEFDGINDHVFIGQPVPLELQMQGALTLEAWIHPYNYPGSSTIGGILACQHDPNPSGYSIMLDGRTQHGGVRGGIHAQLGDGTYYFTNSSEGTTATAVDLLKWTHVAMTWSSGNSFKVYLNGELVTDWRNWTGPIAYTSSNQLAIGGHIDYANRYYNGLIDEVRVWNRQLNQTELQTNILGTLTGNEPNLVGYWKLDEGDGNMTADSTINDNNGVLTNGPVWVESDLMSSIQPDMMIRTDDQTQYTGDDIYNSLPSQTVYQMAAAGMTLIYDLKLENERKALDKFVITGDVGTNGWIVSYFDNSNNSDITSEVTGAGWMSPMMASNTEINLRLEIIADPCLADEATIDIIISALSMSDSNGTDSVKASAEFLEALALPPYGAVYTTNSDFDKGTLVGVEHDTVPDQLQLSEDLSTLPFIWVPNSNEGTVSKVDTLTGKELARYRTGPSSNGNPSRTTVDLYGDCWVGNRYTGTIVKIGLYENGGYMDRNYNGIIETSTDLNGDGEITGSEILPWASDECVIYEVVLIPGNEGTYIPGQYQGMYASHDLNPGPRGIAVDSLNNVWAGCYGSSVYHYIDGGTGQILRSVDVSSTGHTPYGAVIDNYGILWSSGQSQNHVLKLDTSDNSFSLIPLGHHVYGLGVDSNDHLFVSGWQDSKLSRINMRTGSVEWTKTGVYQSRGVACTSDGDVWVADSSPGTVTRWSNDGIIKATINVGNTPTGVAVDAAGKVWVVNYGDEYIHRIDPNTNIIDLSKRIPGGLHYGYSDMTGIIAGSTTASIGSWSVVHNTKQNSVKWGMISWTSNEPRHTRVDVKVRSSDDRHTWSNWEQTCSYRALRNTPEGRYLEVKAMLQSFDEAVTPVLYDLTVNPSPCCGDLEHPYPVSDNNKDCKIDFIDFSIMANEWLDCTSPECD